MKKLKSYRNSILHLIYNLNKYQQKQNRRGKLIPVDICICRERLQEYVQVIEHLQKLGYTVNKTGLVWNNPNTIPMDIPIVHPLVKEIQSLEQRQDFLNKFNKYKTQFFQLDKETEQ
jgi:hypothetical protein